jgi:DNA mismatch endonuclease Vsr
MKTVISGKNVMADVHNIQTRSQNMAAIKQKDTRPEMLARRQLHKAGFRYRLHVADLPSKPDLVFPNTKHSLLLLVSASMSHVSLAEKPYRMVGD